MVPLPELASARDALAILTWIEEGGLRFEDAMRLLYPEGAAKIYNPGRWPCGASRD